MKFYASPLILISMLGCGSKEFYSHKQESNNFKNTISKSKMIVFYNGNPNLNGYKIDAILTISNKQDIKNFIDKIEFNNQSKWTMCLCDGYPHVEFKFENNKSIFVSIQHGDAIRWNGLTGDAALTQSSSAFMHRFLLENKLASDPDRQIWEQTLPPK